MATYIIRAGLTGPVKIGKADDVERRRATLQTAHHEELVVLRVIDTAFDAEPVMHKQFAHLRIRGEWFDFDPEMLTFDPPSPHELVEKSLAGLVSRFGVKRLAERIRISVRTIEGWVSGKTFGPQAKSVVAMLQDKETAPIILIAAGREDLANPGRTIRALREEVIAKHGADHPVVKMADEWLELYGDKVVDAEQMDWLKPRTLEPAAAKRGHGWKSDSARVSGDDLEGR